MDDRIETHALLRTKAKNLHIIFQPLQSKGSEVGSLMARRAFFALLDLGFFGIQGQFYLLLLRMLLFFQITIFTRVIATILFFHNLLTFRVQLFFFKHRSQPPNQTMLLWIQIPSLRYWHLVAMKISQFLRNLLFFSVLLNKHIDCLSFVKVKALFRFAPFSGLDELVIFFF